MSRLLGRDWPRTLEALEALKEERGETAVSPTRALR